MVCLCVLSLGPRAVSDRTMKGIFRTVCSKDRNCGAREWIRTHVQVETQLCPIHKSTNIPYLRLLLYDVMCAFNLNNTQSWQWSRNTHAVVHQSLAWHALCMCHQCGSSIYYATECLQVEYVASTQYMEQSNTDIPTRRIEHTSNECTVCMTCNYISTLECPPLFTEAVLESSVRLSNVHIGDRKPHLPHHSTVSCTL